MNTFNQLVLYLFSTVLMFEQVNTLTLIRSETKLSQPLTKMQLYNGTLYVGGANNLYVLDKNINVLQEANTCIGTCDNINQVLLINDYNNAGQLITCGTGNSGMCEARRLSNITDVLETSSDIVISSDIKRPAEAMICDEDGDLMLAVTFGVGISDFENSFLFRPFYSELSVLKYTSYKYAVSKRNPQFSFTSTDSKIALNINENYLIYYRSSFQAGGFSYFVTNQKEFIGKQNYISKLVRLCQSDNTFSSFVDIPITCMSGGITFNMIQTAVLLKMKTDFVVVGAFTRGNDPEDPEGESVICIEKLSVLNQKLNEATKNYIVNCTETHNNRRYLPDIKPRCVPENDFKPNQFACPPLADSFRYAIGYEAKVMDSAYKFGKEKGYITSMIGAELNGNSVVLAGSSKGRLFQMNIDERKSLTLFEEGIVDDGHEIRSIRQDDDDNLYVMSTEKIFRYKRTSCAEFSTCKETMAAGNPVCGWCIFADRATREGDCPADEWLHSSTQCVTLETDVKGVVAGSQERKYVEVTAQHLTYRNGSGDTYKCWFTDGKNLKKQVDAEPVVSTGNSPKYKCSIPTVPEHTEATLELKVNDIYLASTPFLFYKCSYFKRCRECVDTPGSNCTWHPENAECLEPSAEVYVTDNSKCPQLTDNRGSIFLPTSESRTLALSALNIPTAALTGIWCYVPNDGEDILEEVFVKARTENNSITCSLTIKTTKPSKGQEVRIFILYGRNLASIENLAEFDDDFNNTVTVYSCSELGEDCSHCKALKKQRYNCNWCDNKCQYEKDCSGTCPPPSVTKIIPRDGLWQGGTEVIIYGTELGTSVSDINRVMVAGRSCVLADSIKFGLPKNDYFEKDVPSRIVCTTAADITSMSEYVIVTVNNAKSPERTKFFYKNVTLKDLKPTFGPLVGGTRVTFFGENLGVGNRKILITLDSSGFNISCVDAKVIPQVDLDQVTNVSFTIECVIQTVLKNETRGDITGVDIDIDGQPVQRSVPINFTFRPNPEIKDISPKKGILLGGTGITITGKNMDSAHNAYIVEADGKKTSKCGILSPTTTVCRSPEATEAVKEKLYQQINSSRTKRDDDCKACVIIEVVVYLDGFQEKFTIKYYRDPSIHPFKDKDGVHLFSSETQRLTINGAYINLVAQKSDVNISIGIDTCEVFELKESYITCLAPKDEPGSGDRNLPHPEVNVTIGNYKTRVGYLEYKQTVEYGVIIGGAVGGGLLIILIIGIGIGVYKYRKVAKKAEVDEKYLSDMAMEIKQIARGGQNQHTDETGLTVYERLDDDKCDDHQYSGYDRNATEAVVSTYERLDGNTRDDHNQYSGLERQTDQDGASYINII